MKIIDEILQIQSLSIIGLEKNTGKTETLNYVLGRLRCVDKCIAVTSIGVDGEGIDRVTQTAKPEIILYENMLFVTSEQHYKSRLLTSEIIKVSSDTTALGRLITARVLTAGKVMLSGPSDTQTLKQIISQNAEFGAQLTIVDGALSRKSLGSPAITDAVILATGAALSANIATLVQHTKFVCSLIDLPQIENKFQSLLTPINKGLHVVDKNENVVDLHLESALNLKSFDANKLADAQILFVSGVVSDNILDFIRIQKNVNELTIVVRDFTKIFVSPEKYNAFVKKGGNIKVLYKTKLLAVTVNPTSPQGYKLNSETLCAALRDALNVDVFDVFEK